jgi:peroxiredoxin
MHAGEPAPAFDLPGADGRNHSLDEFADAQLLVVAFWCNHCPYVQAWEGRIIELARTYQPRSVAFALINANDDQQYPDDSLPRMVERAKAKGYPFVYLRDESQEVARAYGALVTPHIFLFGPDRRLLYQGRIDDNHEHPEAVRHRFLANAIDTALTGRPVAQPELSVLGCSVKWRD